MSPRDKHNKIDFRWFIVRSLPHQEKKLAGMLEQYMKQAKNMLEVYCPVHTTVNVCRHGEEKPLPLFAGFVFVLSTQEAVSEFIERYYPEGTILYAPKKEGERKASLLTIPEEQMRLFKDFNENYADQVIILERPYSDYIFNPKTNEPNEIVKIIDGPLAGREGYLARFRRDKRMVFKMKAMGSDHYYTVSIPNIWSLHVVRLHNAEGDRQTVGTRKERAVDLLVGILQDCGYGEQTLPALYDLMDEMVAKPSLVNLCRELLKKGHERLSHRLTQLSAGEAGLILNLVRYEHDNRGYVKTTWPKLVIRPFLTPTSGTEPDSVEDETELPHKDFTEIIRKVGITEQVYYPSREQDDTVTTMYYAHIGIMPSASGEGKEDMFILFANWDVFLDEYFRTSGKANERLVNGTTLSLRGEDANKETNKLIESFRNYAPALYRILTDETSKIRAVEGLKIGGHTLNVMAVTATAEEKERAKDELITTCIRICKEINSTTHLAVWRRYLRTVWLHV